MAQPLSVKVLVRSEVIFECMHKPGEDPAAIRQLAKDRLEELDLGVPS